MTKEICEFASINSSSQYRELVVDLEGYEGPIDVLLVLARQQKVDLIQISILQLAEQYLLFIEEAQRLCLEIAADYLVMAAWLAYLKSRLLLPELDDKDEPSGPEMAEALAFQLRRLEAMQRAGDKIMELPQLDRDFFSRGIPEGVNLKRVLVYDLSLFNLLNAYSEQHKRGRAETLEIEPLEIHSVDDALDRFRRVFGKISNWEKLETFLPKNLRHGIIFKSAIAATFAAGLELVKAGKIELYQKDIFEQIYIRSRVEGADY